MQWFNRPNALARPLSAGSGPLTRIRRFALHVAITATVTAAMVGCGDDEPTDPNLGGDIRGSVDSEGLSRSFILHVPPGNDPDAPSPLIIVFHGATMTGAGMQDLTEFGRFTDANGFLVIYPDGIDGGWSIGCDCTTADQLGISDVLLIEALLADVTSSFAVDLDRVYLAGFSMGGMFAQIASCQLEDRVAAVAIVGTSLPKQLQNDCPLQSPLPILYMIGTEDPVFPYLDGTANLLSAPAALAHWASFNGCQGDAEEVTLPDVDPGDLTRVHLERFADCDAGSESTLYTVEGGGHTWPKGQRPLGSNFGVVSQDIWGSEVITEFFLRH